MLLVVYHITGDCHIDSDDGVWIGSVKSGKHDFSCCDILIFTG